MKDSGVGGLAFWDDFAFFVNDLNIYDRPRFQRHPLQPSPACRAFRTEQNRKDVAQATSNSSVSALPASAHKAYSGTHP